MLRIGLISDTHSYLDEKVFKHFADCNEIWHAGDIGQMKVVENLTAFKPLKAVFGNIDNADIKALFPENLIFNAENLKIVITHIGGKPGKYPARVKKLLQTEKPDIYICGHSHILQVTTDPAYGKMLFINPGAAGNEGFHQVKTLIKFDINGTSIENMKVIELGKRGFSV